MRIPLHLRKNAYIAGSELAWPRHAAVELLDLLLEHLAPVVGVEIWLPTIPGPTIPTPYIYTLTIDPLPEESGAAFAARSGAEARKYVETFDWDPRDLTHKGIEPFFNFEVLAELV